LISALPYKDFDSNLSNQKQSSLPCLFSPSNISTPSDEDLITLDDIDDIFLEEAHSDSNARNLDPSPSMSDSQSATCTVTAGEINNPTLSTTFSSEPTNTESSNTQRKYHPNLLVSCCLYCGSEKTISHVGAFHPV
jgi:hypothetical protein